MDPIKQPSNPVDIKNIDRGIAKTREDMEKARRDKVASYAQSLENQKEMDKLGGLPRPFSPPSPDSQTPTELRSPKK